MTTAINYKATDFLSQKTLQAHLHELQSRICDCKKDGDKGGEFDPKEISAFLAKFFGELNLPQEGGKVSEETVAELREKLLTLVKERCLWEKIPPEVKKALGLEGYKIGSEVPEGLGRKLSLLQDKFDPSILLQKYQPLIFLFEGMGEEDIHNLLPPKEIFEGDSGEGEQVRWQNLSNPNSEGKLLAPRSLVYVLQQLKTKGVESKILNALLKDIGEAFKIMITVNHNQRGRAGSVIDKIVGRFQKILTSIYVDEKVDKPKKGFS